MRRLVFAMTLLLCSLPGEAERRRPVAPDPGPCIASLPAVRQCTLAFVSERDGNPEIYVGNLGGTAVRLTFDPANDTEPTWSPDGRRIAFVSDRDGQSDIYVMDAHGANVSRLTNFGAYHPAWSPDGNRIAFSSLQSGQFGVFVMSLDQTVAHLRPVGFGQGWNAYPAWSPDGEGIAFTADARMFDFVYDLYVAKADGSDITPVLRGPFTDSGAFDNASWRYYFQPSFSPDGERLAVVQCGYARTNCYPDSAIAIVNRDGSELRTLAQAGGYSKPTWSPDGGAIAFGSRSCPSCPAQLRYVSADGSASGVIFTDGYDPAWRPGSRAAAVPGLVQANH